jgi:transcriptional regulator with XRE-family HTH domain
MGKFLSMEPESTLKIKELIGKRIREERKALGKTQGELAAIIGISTSHLSQIENGQKSLDLEKLQTMADALGINTSLLLTCKLVEARGRLPLVDGRYLSILPDSDPVHAAINRIASWDMLGHQSRSIMQATIAQHRLQVSKGELPHITHPLKTWMEEQAGLIAGDSQQRPSIEWLTNTLKEEFKTIVTTPDMKMSYFHGKPKAQFARNWAIRKPKKRWSRKPSLLHLSPRTANNPFLTRHVLAMEIVCNVNNVKPPNPNLGDTLPENLNEVLVHQDLLIGSLELLVSHQELEEEYEHWLTSPPRNDDALNESANRLELPPHLLLIAMGRSLQLRQNKPTYALYLNRYNLDPQSPLEEARKMFFIEPLYNYGNRSSVRGYFSDGFVYKSEHLPLCKTNAGSRALVLNSTHVQEEFDSRSTGNKEEPSYAVISTVVPSESNELRQSVTLGIRDPRLIRALHRNSTSLANLTPRVETGYKCVTCPANIEDRCTATKTVTFRKRLQ